MNILVTGAKGFVGKNLVENLKNIRDKKNNCRPNIAVDEIYEYDLDSSEKDLDYFCSKADFVFNLAGVNRTNNPEDFKNGNYGFATKLLNSLKKHGNKCPIMLSSSIQATLIGRYDGEYGRSKLLGEELFFEYGKETGAKVLVYRFTNIVGKWVRPNYNSAVGTFCNNIANDLPITVNDENTELELLFIDDLVEEMLNALENKETHCSFDGLNAVIDENGKYCTAKPTYKRTLGEIVKWLYKFKEQPTTLVMPEIPNNSFEKKLYSMYLSYLPKEKISYPLKMNVDNRGSFTELIKSEKCGQISVNITKAGITKGEHWHNSKWEIFIVIKGHGLIQQRKIGSDEIYEFEVDGNKLEAVQILPGYTHNIKNLSETEDLVTLMWANEQFNKDIPDTFFEKV